MLLIVYGSVLFSICRYEFKTNSNHFKLNANVVLDIVSYRYYIYYDFYDIKKALLLKNG